VYRGVVYELCLKSVYHGGLYIVRALQKKKTLILTETCTARKRVWDTQMLSVKAVTCGAASRGVTPDCGGTETMWEVNMGNTGQELTDARWRGTTVAEPTFTKLVLV